ncbi:N-acetylmuramoyl-L-alanine amidase [Niastella koreensis]|uniref:N-acetylmuramoyl-L-alanine amidase n=2 Tax=Niastella koreensis TaxID=354356 RepID=G8TK05_NIAKG|nr:N-acetylmuramoyl-L-alanine amidase [Niastella koreensis]AEW02943.1 N-acetylmuramyl-L-alanine amidase, negative regulator of AmpC, AmpD [Niastella koreensis GR20-10]OQP55259.1 N-acetylmuramoyl-L-alanine amidase [Niastella koreensis]
MRVFAGSLFFAIVISALVYSCAHNPYAKTNRFYKKQAKQLANNLKPVPNKLLLDSAIMPVYAVATTNFDLRKPNFVIIHHTAQNSCEQTLKTFTLQRTKVSAHYVICKDGTIHHMLNDYLRAWQAGVSKWGNFTDINSSSIGIELDNNGNETFPEAQITSLMKLLDTLKSHYSIPAANFIGHADVAPGRKNDPSHYFPWQALSQRGFGLWYDTTAVVVPEYFNTTQALRIIGYNVKDTLAAIRSFKIHFVPQDTVLIKTLTDDDRKILFDLERRYQ